MWTRIREALADWYILIIFVVCLGAVWLFATATTQQTLNANGTGSGADKRGEVAGATTAAIRNTARAVTAGSESANECSRFNRSFRSATR